MGQHTRCSYHLTRGRCSAFEDVFRGQEVGKLKCGASNLTLLFKVYFAHPLWRRSPGGVSIVFSALFVPARDCYRPQPRPLFWDVAGIRRTRTFGIGIVMDGVVNISYHGDRRPGRVWTRGRGLTRAQALRPGLAPSFGRTGCLIAWCLQLQLP